VIERRATSHRINNSKINFIIMQRLSAINMQFASTGKRTVSPKKKNLKPIVADVWESMGMDQYLSSRAVQMRKATAKVMDDCY